MDPPAQQEIRREQEHPRGRQQTIERIHPKRPQAGRLLSGKMQNYPNRRYKPDIIGARLALAY
jgi:hypothetical protein